MDGVNEVILDGCPEHRPVSDMVERRNPTVQGD
ncbi:hypothetical protein SHIRM173S_12350 [Streptomyces hirsutus]